MRGSAAAYRRIDWDRFDGVTPAGPRVASADQIKAWFDRRPCDLVVEAGGARVAVRQSAGRGLPVLMLHGAGASKEVFHRQFDGPLAQNHRLIAIDLPDRAGRDGTSEAHVLARQADVAAELVEVLGLRDLAVLGWGRGAAVALALARGRGVAAVVVTGAPLSGLGGAIERATAAGIPVASIQGSEDASASVADVGSALWRGASHILPGAGHAPFLDSPELFNPLLGLFLGEVARGL